MGGNRHGFITTSGYKIKISRRQSPLVPAGCMGDLLFVDSSHFELAGPSFG